MAKVRLGLGPTVVRTDGFLKSSFGQVHGTVYWIDSRDLVD